MKDCPRHMNTYEEVNDAYDNLETNHPNYMDYDDPEMDELPAPTIQPQADLT